MPKSALFSSISFIDSFDNLLLHDKPYQNIVNGFKSIGERSPSWVSTTKITLKGKEIHIGNPFYNQLTETVCFLLDYNSQKVYLEENKQLMTLDREISNANKALSLSNNATLTFVPLGMGVEGLMVQLRDNAVLTQLIEQLGPLSDKAYQNDEYPEYQQAP